MPDAPETRASSPAARTRAALVAATGAALLGLALPALTQPTPAAPIELTALGTVAGLPEAMPPHAPNFEARNRQAAAEQAAQERRERAARAARTRRELARKEALRPKWVRPSYSGVVSNFGPRWGRLHKGIDFGGGYGDTIRSVGDGVVVGSGYLGEESGYGIITIIRHANGYYTAYAHQARSIVDAGESVKAGETIGYVGSTGHSTGAHLHFEVRTSVHGGQVNPITWLRKQGVSI
jgi:murein DD-endopeptidase MepM/ murein hydrolase activator NlpD